MRKSQVVTINDLKLAVWLVSNPVRPLKYGDDVVVVCVDGWPMAWPVVEGARESTSDRV